MKRPTLVLRSLSLALLLAGSAAVPAAGQLSETMVLRAGDVLRITVWIPNAQAAGNLSGEFPVETSGFAYLPGIGEVRVAGVPMEELRRDLRSRYAERIQNPVVTIIPLMRVGLLGAVRRPGVYQVTPDQTIIDVITQAGGFLGAKEENVRIQRGSQLIEVNAARALEGVVAEDLSLRSGDQIIVPEAGLDWRTAFEIVRTVGTIFLIVDRIQRR